MRKLACAAAGFAAAVFAFVYLGTVPMGLVAAAVCAGLFAALCFVRRDWSRRAALVLVGAAIGFGWCAAYWQWYLLPIANLDGQTQTVTVTAADYSRETDYGSTAQVSLAYAGRTYAAVLYYDGEQTLSPGDTVRVKAALRQTASAAHEGDAYLGSKGKNLILSARTGLSVTSEEGLAVRYWPVAFSNRLRQSIETSLKPDTAAFMTALVTGDRTDFPFALKNQLSVAGLYHAVAISGMHVSILLGILLAVLGNGRRKAALIGLPIIWFYTLAVGAGPPVIRAAVMQTFLLLAPLLKRENDTPTALLAALALILLPNPRAAADVSLQLSFASIAGILLFSGRCFHYFWDNPRVKALRKRSRHGALALKVVLASLASSLAVLPTTLPLSAAYFGMFSFIAPLASVLVLPVISVCFSWGLLAGLVGMLLPTVGAVFAWPLHGLVGYCTGAAGALAKIPFAAVYTNDVYMLIFAAFFYAIVLFFAVAKRKCAKMLPVCCTLGMLCLCLLLGSLELDRASLSLTMLNVGQGQCVYLESGGVSAIYDCGGEGEETGEIAARHLKSLGRSRVDFLILSHYDSDHAEGAAYLLSSLPVGMVLLPEVQTDSDMRALLVAAAKDAQVPVRFVSEDQELAFGGGTIRLYAPQSEQSSNDGSMAALCSAGEFDVLLTGDLSTYGEQALLRAHDFPAVEVLAAGHHGAASSSSAALLRVLRPEIALISVGADNSYGHPAPETLARLQKAGVKIYRTDQCGNITIRR